MYNFIELTLLLCLGVWSGAHNALLGFVSFIRITSNAHFANGRECALRQFTNIATNITKPKHHTSHHTM